MSSTDFEQTLRERFAGEVAGIVPPEDLAGRARAAGRSRRRHRLVRGGVGAVAVAVLGVGLGLPHLSTTRRPQVTVQPAPAFAYVLASSTTTRAFATVDGYEVTWLPAGIEPSGPVETFPVDTDPADPRLRSVTRMQRFLPRARGADSWFDLQIVSITGGDAAAVGRAYERGLAETRKLLQPGETLEQGTLATGAGLPPGPAYIRTRHDGEDIDLISLPDPRTGTVVVLKMHRLTRAQMEAVIAGIRVQH